MPRGIPNARLDKSNLPGGPVPESAASIKGRPLYDPDGSADSGAGNEFASFAGTVRDSAIPLEYGGSVDREVAEAAAFESHSEPHDLQADIERIRAFRKPIGSFFQKLALPPVPGYKQHWFNDVAGRIAEATANGWAHVTGTDGKPLCRAVGTGKDNGALYAYAMKLPLVFWQEDMDLRHAQAAEKIEGLKNSPFRAPQGSAQAADKGKFYDPTDSASGPISIQKH